MKANEVLNFGKEILISNSKNRKSIYKNSFLKNANQTKKKNLYVLNYVENYKTF